MVILCILLCRLQIKQSACLSLLSSHFVSYIYSLIVLNLLVNYIIHTIYLSKKGQKSHWNTISSTGTIQLPVDSPQWPVIRSNIYLLEYISYLIIIYNIHVQGQCLCLPEFALTGSLRASRSYPRCLPHRLNANHRTVCQSSDTVAKLSVSSCVYDSHLNIIKIYISVYLRMLTNHYDLVLWRLLSACIYIQVDRHVT